MSFPPFSEKALSIAPYPEAEREKKGERNFIRLSSNENPYGPSPRVEKEIKKALKKLHMYPSSLLDEPRKLLAEKLNVAPENIIFGKGSNEIIELSCKAFLEEGDKVVVTSPCFPMYKTYSILSGARVVEVPIENYRADINGILEKMENAKMVFLNSPMNPTGTLITEGELLKIAEKAMGSTVVFLDEAYVDFAEDMAPNSISLVKKGYPIIIARSFSKSYGLAGLRAGFGISHEDVISVMARTKQPYNLGTLEEAAIKAAIEDMDYMKRTVSLIVKERERMEEELKNMGVKFVKSYANFILIILGKRAKEVYRKLIKMGIYTRYMDSYKLPDCIRVTVGRKEENDSFLSAMKKILREGQ